MKFPRVRFTVRRIMILVAVLALGLAGGRWAYERYWAPTFSWTYAVSDLLASPDGSGPQIDLNEYPEILKSSVGRDLWWSSRTVVTPFNLSDSMITRQTKEGHRLVTAWLRGERLRRASLPNARPRPVPDYPLYPPPDRMD